MLNQNPKPLENLERNYTFHLHSLARKRERKKCGKGIPFPSHLNKVSPIHIKSSTIKPFLFQPHPRTNTSSTFLNFPATMHNSICENLLETGEAEDDYFLADVEDIDEPDSISLLCTILSGTARLNVLLPAATVLAFTIFSPLITKDGQCSTLDRWLMGFFLVLSAASCVFFAFTDSFRTATGRLYYGVATFNGIWTFCGGRKMPCVPSDYRLRWGDLFHSSLSLLAFLTVAASHSDFELL